MKIRIEKMSFGDLVSVTQLAAQLGYPNSLVEIQTRFLKMENDPCYALFVSKDENEKITGYIQVNREPHTLLAETRSEVAALIVDENVRSNGIGAALLVAAENWAKENGITLMRVRSNVKRQDAHRFYERHLYKIKKSWHLFTKNLS
jgi:GNAT superfamily N-acetyltransferase